MALDIPRRGFLQVSALAGSGALIPPTQAKPTKPAAPWAFNPGTDIIQAPSDPALWPQFREQLTAWRSQARAELSYDDALYNRPDFHWAASSYACLFVMMYDERFYDAQSGRYTVDALLDVHERDFGGCDSVVLWHAYPRIGVDERNQFDFYRDMPGGLGGVRDAVRQFHARGIKVYLNYNPWDRTTRREPKSDIAALADMVAALEADGMFLDTMKEGAAEMRTALDRVRPGVVLEGEVTPPLPRVADHHASWAQWFDDSEVPGVLRLKWFERRHMQHQTQRWNNDHGAELHTAWMNGTGIMVWENVFGAWVPWHARDRSLLRAMLPVQRRYARLFRGEGWTPLVPTTQRDVYASLWAEGELKLWTLVNRSEQLRRGTTLQVPATPGLRWFDLIAGRELKPRVRSGQAQIELALPPRGIGGVLALPAAQVDAGFTAFLARQAATHERADFDTTRPIAPMRTAAVQATPRPALVPAGMIEMTRNVWTKSLAVHMRQRECGYFDSNVTDGEGFRYTYDYRLAEFTRPWTYRRYAMDETPVTNAQYLQFLRASGYQPAVATNFLRHWVDGKPPAGKEDHPVVWVDLDDARAYAKFHGKRLPSDDEWQYAAQSGEGNEYPWGNSIRLGAANYGETGGTTPVKAFPDGRTNFGLYDMAGNVWHWTESAATEGRTRFAIIRGGSWFVPKAGQWSSHWNVDGGVRPASLATKFLLMWPGLDRCSTVGFRCVVDLA